MMEQPFKLLFNKCWGILLCFFLLFSHSILAQNHGFIIMDKTTKSATCIGIGNIQVKIKLFNEKEIQAILIDIDSIELVLKPDKESTTDYRLNMGEVKWIRFESEQNLTPMVSSILLGTSATGFALTSIYYTLLYPNPAMNLLLIPNFIFFVAIHPIIHTTYKQYFKRYYLDIYSVQRIGERLK
jgi:hypothetical protein